MRLDSTVQTAAAFDGVFKRRLEHPEVFAEHVGGKRQFSAISVITRRDIARHKNFLQSFKPFSPTLLDLGCGLSLYGYDLSRGLPSKYIGLDYSSVALQGIRESLETQDAKRFKLLWCSFEKLPLEDASATHCLSFDAMYLARSAHQSLQEVFRVMRCGSAIIFTTFCSEPGNRSQIAGPDHDWTTTAASLGFDIVGLFDVTDDWRRAMRRKHSARWRSRNKLRHIYGAWIEPEIQVSAALLGEGGLAAQLDVTRRCEIHMRKP